nr:MAG TPA: hypothetical protein [Caudoviricetes sp.]
MPFLTVKYCFLLHKPHCKKRICEIHLCCIHTSLSNRRFYYKNRSLLFDNLSFVRM